jgi:hypothetical protein
MGLGGSIEALDVQAKLLQLEGAGAGPTYDAY